MQRVFMTFESDLNAVILLGAIDRVIQSDQWEDTRTEVATSKPWRLPEDSRQIAVYTPQMRGEKLEGEFSGKLFRLTKDQVDYSEGFEPPSWASVADAYVAVVPDLSARSESDITQVARKVLVATSIYWPTPLAAALEAGQPLQISPGDRASGQYASMSW